MPNPTTPSCVVEKISASSILSFVLVPSQAPTQCTEVIAALSTPPPTHPPAHTNTHTRPWVWTDEDSCHASVTCEGGHKCWSRPTTGHPGPPWLHTLLPNQATSIERMIRDDAHPSAGKGALTKISSSLAEVKSIRRGPPPPHLPPVSLSLSLSPTQLLLEIPTFGKQTSRRQTNTFYRAILLPTSKHEPLFLQHLFLQLVQWLRLLCEQPLGKISLVGWANLDRVTEQRAG